MQQAIAILEYMDAEGRSPFGNWFGDLDAVAAAKVTVAITRLGAGNTSNVKGVGTGVLECRIDFGPGYRIYFGKDGKKSSSFSPVEPRSGSSAI